MGVKNLQDIIKAYGKSMTQNHYSAAIIDGNNLFVMKIAGVVSRLYKKYPIPDFNGINMNIIDQIYVMINNIKNECMAVINSVLKNDNTDVVYIVFDPISTPKYKISKDMIYMDDVLLEDTEYKEFLLGDNDELIFDIKANEQEKRKAAQTKRSNIEIIIDNIDKLSYEEPIKNILKDIAKQSAYFNQSTTNVLKLMPLAIGYIYKEVQNQNLTNIKFIQSIVEADLSIRNLGQKLLNNGADNILILSADTDYYILFGDCDRAYCRSLMLNNIETYNPKQVFQALLGDNYSYDVIVRLAPIFGNDYTVHESISDAKNVKNVLNLMNIQGHPLDLTNVRARKIKEIIHNNNQTILSAVSKKKSADIENSDYFIYTWNPDYFRCMLMSILVYRNYQSFDNEYQEFIMTDKAIKEVCIKLQNLLHNIFKEFYDWKYINSIHTATFLTSLSDIDFDYDNSETLYNILSEMFKNKLDITIESIDVEDLPSIDSE